MSIAADKRIAARRASWSAYYYRQPALNAWAKAAKHNSRRRAKLHHIDHNLTTDQILNLIPPDGLCPILGIPLQIAQGNQVSGAASATIDRIDSTGPYDASNCHVISNLCNRGKSAMNINQLIKLGKWAEQFAG